MELKTDFDIVPTLTLRDYLAAKEKAVLSNLFWSNKYFQKSIIQQSKEEDKHITNLLCEMAYFEADVMLKQRES